MFGKTARIVGSGVMVTGAVVGIFAGNSLDDNNAKDVHGNTTVTKNVKNNSTVKSSDKTANDSIGKRNIPNNKKVPDLSGWVFHNWYQHAQPVGYMNTTFKVPSSPSTYSNNTTLFFFPGLLDSSWKSLMQPVLQFGPSAAGGQSGKWYIANWHVYNDGSFIHDKLIEVKPGDTIYGSMYNSNCKKGTNDCDWTIFVRNNTTGKNNVMRTHDKVPYVISTPNVLEAYDAYGCTMLPRSTMKATNINVFNNARKPITPPSWKQQINDKQCKENIVQNTAAKWSTLRWNGLN